MLLDTFAFLFETEGTDEVKNSLKDISKETDNLSQHNNNLATSFGDVMAAVSPLLATYAMLKESVNFAQTNETLLQFSQISGVTAQALSGMGIAAQRFGGNASTMNSAIMTLNRNMMQLRKTGGGAYVNAGMHYGIKISRDPEQMLKNIAKRMETLTKEQQLDFGLSLGLDVATIRMLQGGLKNLEEELARAQKYNFITDKTVENSHELLNSYRDFSDLLHGLGQVIMTDIHPFVMEIFDILKTGVGSLIEHKEAVIGLAGAFGALWLVSSPIPKIIAFITGTGGIITAIAAAIALITEDIAKYLQGQDSLIGKLFEKYPEFKNFCDGIGDLFSTLWTNINDPQVWEDLKASFNELVNWWDNTPLEEKFQGIWETLQTAAIDCLNAIEDYIVNDSGIIEAWNSIVEGFSDAWTATMEYLTKIFDDFLNACESGSEYVADVVVTGYEDMRDAVVDTYESMKDAAVDTYDSIKDSIVEGSEYVADSVVDSYESLKKAIGDALDWIYSKFKAVSDFISGTFLSVIERIKSIISSLSFDNISDSVKSFLGLDSKPVVVEHKDTPKEGKENKNPIVNNVDYVTQSLNKTQNYSNMISYLMSSQNTNNSNDNRQSEISIVNNIVTQNGQEYAEGYNHGYEQSMKAQDASYTMQDMTLQSDNFALSLQANGVKQHG